MSTVAAIASHAQARPGAVALVNGGRSVSFAELHRDMGKVTAAVRELRLSPGSTVAVGCADLYVHWLLLLACECLKVVTASFDRMETPATYRELLASADLVLADTEFSISGAATHCAITETWVHETMSRADGNGASAIAPAPGDLIRILRSSGSTGQPKRLAITRHMYERRIARYAKRYQFARGSRYMLALPFSVGHIYYAATACLRAGGTVVTVPTARGGAGVFAEYGITHVSLQPLLLKQILDDLPHAFAKPVGLAVFSFGSPTSDELGHRALERLATEVTECFGCNEVGNISGRRISLGDEFGTVAADVGVEVVDDEDRPAPWGEPGRLRIRSESMVTGYLDDPNTTLRFFKDGWFYPSDLAILDGPGRLKVIGRSDEMITIAGGKRSPERLEALVMQHVSVGDVAICTFPNREGIQEAYVAVAGIQVDPRELLNRITLAFRGVPMGRFHVVSLPSIPRSPAGKIQRVALRQAVAAAVERGRGPR